MYRQERSKDRRSGMRFEVVGLVRATATTDEPLRVCNLTPGGALVEAPWPLRENSVHTVRLEVGSTLTTVHARVCHATRREGLDSYAIGLEFVSPDVRVLERLEVLLQPTDGVR